MKLRNRAALGFFFSTPLNLQHIPLNPTASFLCLFSSLSSSSVITTNLNSALVDCLTNTYKFTATQALSFSNRFSSVKSPNKPQSVHKFFRELGFSETQIRSAVRSSPNILFSDVNKTLGPKFEFFKQLGVKDSDLCKIISKNSVLLRRSLKKRLVPFFEIVTKILGSDGSNEDFLRFLGRYRFGDSRERLLANCAFLESIGIVGSRLSLIFKLEPYILLMPESKLRDLVSRALDMGFCINSKMFDHGLLSISKLSNDTLKKKLDFIGSFGFSEAECMEIFKRAPVLPRASMEKLKFGLEFYLYTVNFKRSVLISSPCLLMLSMKKRVIPRHKVFQLLKLKKLFKREPRFHSMLLLTDYAFLKKYILRFRDDAEELLVAYKGQISVSSDEEES